METFENQQSKRVPFMRTAVSLGAFRAYEGDPFLENGTLKAAQGAPSERKKHGF